MSLLDLLALMALTYWVGTLMRNKAHQALDREIGNLQRDLDSFKKVYKKVTIEQHGDMLYVWEHGTDQFLCQGRTAQDFQDRIPHDMVFGIVEGDIEAVTKFKKLFPRNES